MMESNLGAILKQIEQIADIGYWEFDLETDNYYWSDGVYKILGYSKEDFVLDHHKVVSLIHPDDKKRVEQHLLGVYSDENSYEIRAKFIHKSGKPIIIESKTRLEEDAEGKPVKVSGVFRNITPSVEAGMHLTNLQLKLSDLLDSVGGCLWEADGRTIEFSYISPQLEKLLGYSADEWMADAKFWESILHPEDREFAVSFCQNEIRQDRNHVFDYRIRHKEGHYLWVQDRVSVLRNGDKIDLKGMLIDITEQKKVEQNLRDQRNLTNQLIQQLPNVFFLFNQSGEFLLWNQRLTEVTEYNDSEMSNLSPLDFFEGEAREIVEKEIRSVLEKGNAEIDVEFTSKSGVQKPIHFIASRFTFNGENCIYGLGIDMSEKKEMIETQKKLLHTIENILEFAPEGMLVLTEKLELFKQNNSFDKLIKEYSSKLNYTESELRTLIINKILSQSETAESFEIEIESNPKK